MNCVARGIFSVLIKLFLTILTNAWVFSDAFLPGELTQKPLRNLGLGFRVFDSNQEVVVSFLDRVGYSFELFSGNVIDPRIGFLMLAPIALSRAFFQSNPLDFLRDFTDFLGKLNAHAAGLVLLGHFQQDGLFQLGIFISLAREERF